MSYSQRPTPQRSDPASAHHSKRAVVFQRLAAQEGDPQERERLLKLARYEKGQAKLYRMVERRGSNNSLTRRAAK
ncbi:MAG TPA: hypothetical protein VLL28_07930 [Hyphomicrobiaceae bacterium]|nr:hypothetical protein [Hyphomicrobiaceae bacterium]